MCPQFEDGQTNSFRAGPFTEFSRTSPRDSEVLLIRLLTDASEQFGLLIDPLPRNVPSDVVPVEGDVVGARVSENVLVVGKVVTVLPLLIRLTTGFWQATRRPQWKKNSIRQRMLDIAWNG